MLYLEDYLELIEHLPQELRDRFTEMREMDLQVQNSMDTQDDRVKNLFSNAKKMKTSEREELFQNIKQQYCKILEDADEKVHLANDMYDLLERYVKRLDQDLHKFKMELEADNRGITEILEKKSMELDQPLNAQKFERESRSFSTRSQDPKQNVMIGDKSVSDIVQLHSNPNQNYSLGHIGVGNNAIAAAASQAIAATKQMAQGRRTASLKASYEAVNLGVHTQEFSIGRELASTGNGGNKLNVGSSAGSTSSADSEIIDRKQRKRKSQAGLLHPAPSPQSVGSLNESLNSELPSEVLDSDWNMDPNEPRYCVCNQVSYGDMVACDNPQCPFEWFHYPCVGITDTPKGNWYCPRCLPTIKRKSRR